MTERPGYARRPRSRGLFTRVSKSFGADMLAAGVSLEAGMLYTLMTTDPATSALGYVYRKQEWSTFPGSNNDTIDRLVGDLERAGFIVADGWHLVIRGYLRRNAFDQPSYLRSGLYDLQRSLTQPLLRCVIGSEFLRLNLVDMPQPKSSNTWQAAAPLWSEITGGAVLPPAHHMLGDSGTEPHPMMLDSLAAMPDSELAYQALDARQWTVVAGHLVDPLQSAFQRQPWAGRVTPIRTQKRRRVEGGGEPGD